MKKNIETFLGCHASYHESGLVIFGAPFDSTASYRPGSRFAPAAMRAESWALETYSPYQNRDLAEAKTFDAGNLELPFGDPRPALAMVEDFAGNILGSDKTPVMLGGEHLLSLGLARALVKKYPGLHVIHFDAHCDLRHEYLGQTLSHATVLRRIWELTGDNKIFQFGVRSGTREEFAWAETHTQLNKFDFNGLVQTVAALQGAPVFFTLDLDVLDPSILPGTGTPEAGGVGFKELMAAIGQLKTLNVVGMDINELCPAADTSGVSTLVACKILREIILLFNQGKS